mmetsp:Transcript_24521/g.61241  ORF Transcript_24521/g.61241 Transcript_24521/m.61241 type:complete len:222 (+) Transcript_24521:445-1110(+)
MRLARYFSAAVFGMSWLTMRRLTAMSEASRDVMRRLDSESERTVGMVTTTNSEALGLRIISRRSVMLARNFSRFFSALSREGGGPPKMLIVLRMAVMRPLSLTMRPRNPSRKSGKDRRRSVWPVGAVSMTTRSKRSDLRSSTTWVSATSSSIPGGTLSRIPANSSTPSCRAISLPNPWPSLTKDNTSSRNSFTAASVSTSIPYNILFDPSMSTGPPPSRFT